MDFSLRCSIFFMTVQFLSFPFYSHRNNAVLNVQVNSEHPLAKAIVEYSKRINGEHSSEGYQQHGVGDFEAIPGQGVRALVDGKRTLVGNMRLMKEFQIDISEEVQEHLQETETLARTGVMVAMDKELVGVVSIADPVKPEAAKVISILKSMGVRSLMVTGDNWGTAMAIAREIGIERPSIYAESLPEDKGRIVKEIQVCSLPFYSNTKDFDLGFESRSYCSEVVHVNFLVVFIGSYGS